MSRQAIVVRAYCHLGTLSLVLILTCLLRSACAADFPVARRGRASCVIVRQAGATPAEIHAVDELANTLSQMTGATFEVRDALPTGKEAAIVVGPGAAAAMAFPDVDLAKFGGEEVVERTAGNRMLLAGGRPRGTLYAVYRFLQDQCGVRWWTPWATDIPKNRSLFIPALDVRAQPAFENREPYWFPAIDANWSPRNFCDGFHSEMGEAQGGVIKYGGFVHTFYAIVPPDPYFTQHPEWFSLVNGKRTATNAQLCLTNQALRDFVVERIRAMLRADPTINILSLSQNDCFNPCECEHCKAIDDAEGSHAGSLIDFVNYVADQIRPEFPNVALDTLAYQYTRHAPKSIRPRPNVIVRLCSIECNFAAPFDDPTNAAFFSDLTAWSKLCQRLYVWDYSTDFGHYVQPHPNWFVLGPDMKIFAHNGVKGVFSEGAYQSNGSEMAEMRGWVLARLMWNPDADADALIDEFLTGYYGKPAAPFIRRYLDHMTKAAHGFYLSCGSGVNAPFLDFAPLNDAEHLWQQAEAASAGDSEKLWRVRQGHLPVRCAFLQRWTTLKNEAHKSNAVWPLPESRKVVADDWLAVATGPGPAGWTPMTHVNEGGQTPQGFAVAFATDPAPPGPPPVRRANPPPPADIPAATGGIDAQDDLARLAEEGTWSETRADPSASDGVATWMPNNHTQWAFQIPVDKLPKAAQSGKWKVYASIRLQGRLNATADKPFLAFSAGVWDVNIGAPRAEIHLPISLDSVTDGKYHSYLIGTVELKPGQYVWVAPTGAGPVDAVWVDRIYLAPGG